MESQFTNEQKNGEENQGYAFYTMPQPEEIVIPDPENRKYGLGRAIAANILCVVSVVFSVIAMFMILFGISGVDPNLEEVGAGMLVVGVVFTIVGTVTAIISLVLGIKSILCFKKRTPRPIATLVLGIIATATAAEGLVLVIYDFFIAFIVLIALLAA